jgi:hypothetical protein
MEKLTMKSLICSLRLASEIGRMWLKTLLVLGFMLVSFNASAECFTLANAPLDADCVVMPHGTTRGVWFRLDKASELRQLALEAPELRLQASKALEAVKLRDGQVVLYLGAIDAQRQAVESLKVANVLLVRQANDARGAALKAQDELSAWYRSPVLWFGVGVISSVVAGVAIVQAVQ